MKTYLEVLKNQIMVQYIYPGPIKPLVFSGWILVKICYYTIHINRINFLGVFPCLFYFYKVHSPTPYTLGSVIEGMCTSPHSTLEINFTFMCFAISFSLSYALKFTGPEVL